MAELVIMPKLGFNMDNGKLVKWYKNEGDSIEKGEAFFSVETDKTSIDIEATSKGIVRKILIEEGETIAVTLPIAIVSEKNEDINELTKEAYLQLGKDIENIEKTIEIVNENVNMDSSNEEDTSKQKVIEGKKKITPRAKKIIKENNIDVSCLNGIGSGFQGGVTERDVKEYLENNKIKITPLANKLAKIEDIRLDDINGTGVKGKIIKSDIEKVVNEKRDSVCKSLKNIKDGKQVLKTTPYSGIRKVIGDRLSESKFTAPHLYFKTSVDMTEVLKLRKQVNEIEKRKTSVTDFIINSVAKALKEYSAVNSSIQGDEIVEYKSINIGIAVASENGLIVPVVKDIQDKNLIEVSENIEGLIKKARNGNLMPEEYQGGTFTVSNLGMFGIENFTAIINPPESAILAVSATKKKTVVVCVEGEERIEIRPMMNITLSVDHRVIDGLLATQFVNKVKELLENPLSILL